MYKRQFYQIQEKQLIFNEEALKPQLLEDDVLIKVKAIGINRADLLQLEGKYDSPDGSDVPGLEVSGIDVATGEEICALLTSGGYSNYVIAKRALTWPKPKNLSFVEAACLPESLATIWLNLFSLSNLTADKKILIHAGASGIGSFAIKAAKCIGAYVVATASSPEKQEFCQKLGADYTTNYHEFNQSTRELGGVDIILDILGGSYLNANLSCLKNSGTIVLLAVMNGSHANIHLGRVLMKNLRIIGSTLRSKSTKQKATLMQDAWQFFTKHYEANNLRPVVHQCFDFSAVQQAHAMISANNNLGKVALTVN